MALFQIEHNIPEFEGTLRRFGRNLDYGISQALNGTVLAAQKAVRASMPETFHIRNAYVQRGLQVRLSSKSDLTARIGHPLEWMRLQEMGGEKDKGGHAMAIPIGPGGPSPAFPGLHSRNTRSHSVKWPKNPRVKAWTMPRLSLLGHKKHEFTKHFGNKPPFLNQI